MANFGFVTVDTAANPCHETTAQQRARILARDAAEREDAETAIIGQAVVSSETGQIMPITGKKRMHHEYCAVYENGMSYTFDGSEQGGKYQHYTVLAERFDAVMGG